MTGLIEQVVERRLAFACGTQHSGAVETGDSGRKGRRARWLLWALCLLIGIGWGCTPVPSQYVRMAELNVTLTKLHDDPERYKGKVVIFGGTIVERDMEHHQRLFRLANRPLDQDYIPHLPVDPHGLEAGHYWTVDEQARIPESYEGWSGATVVGRVTGLRRRGGEPVLELLYVKGWSAGEVRGEGWEASTDPNYVITPPAGVRGEFGGIPP